MSSAMESTAIAPGALERVAFDSGRIVASAPDGGLILPRSTPVAESALGVRWSGTGLAIPAGVWLPDGEGGALLFDGRACFIADEGRALPIYASHDPERMLGTGWIVWAGGGWHMRSTLAHAPSDGAWSPRIRPYLYRDEHGCRTYSMAKLDEVSLAPVDEAVWGFRTRASLALETRDLWGSPIPRRGGMR